MSAVPGLASTNELRGAFVHMFDAPPDDAAEAADAVLLDWIESPLGPLLAGATRDAVVLLEFSDRKIMQQQLQTLRKHVAAHIVPGTNLWLDRLRAQLAEYFAGRRRDFDLPLRYPGTAFQQRIWDLLMQIPYGETRSYLQLARQVGDAGASRAVGAANGMNRIAIVVPCHRVVNSNGELAGYGGGLWRKRVLLDLERGQGELLTVVHGQSGT